MVFLLKAPINRSIIGINVLSYHRVRSGMQQHKTTKAQRGFSVPLLFCAVCIVLLSAGCSTHRVLTMETTAYCGCAKCCSWERGRWLYLKLNFWNRYVSTGSRKGMSYSGKTAKGTDPKEPQPGLFSPDSLSHPWMIPVRTVFPWLWLHHDGTIAADTKYYPFGTRMFVPGWGWGEVVDRGGAIKGPDRIDLFFNNHHDALLWGRKRVPVEIVPP